MLSANLTKAAQKRLHFLYGIPNIAPEEHQFLIHGLVEKPLKFDIESLMRCIKIKRNEQ